MAFLEKVRAERANQRQPRRTGAKDAEEDAGPRKGDLLALRAEVESLRVEAAELRILADSELVWQEELAALRRKISFEQLRADNTTKPGPSRRTLSAYGRDHFLRLARDLPPPRQGRLEEPDISEPPSPRGSVCSAMSTSSYGRESFRNMAYNLSRFGHLGSVGGSLQEAANEDDSSEASIGDDGATGHLRLSDVALGDVECQER
eukprot:TRINITY_DN123771_c0_g1_i1.p1 TRINITY_DN123771_c0_g1~~TRINITY_DN123771_c0_g1_i1.p1  ORF type:complete len:205 (+),score=34.61 TRINITY_DN123771_c0_g1_i1:109-723(+)